MANWAKGLAAGLETGYRMGEMYQKGAERRALQEAAQATPEMLQGYTAEQGAELEAAAKSGLYDIGMRQDAQGNFQGYTVTPKASPEMQGLVAPGQVSEMYGQRYAGTLAPEQVQGLRMGRMADIVAETDPIKAQQMKAAQAEQEYLAKSRPMQLESAGLQLEGARADAADRKRMTDFQSWVQEDPARGQNFQAVAAKARELGMSTKQQYEIASSLTGIDEAEFKANQNAIRKQLQGKDLNGALAAHKDSDLITPGSHYEVVRGKNGQVSLNNVDTATGKIIQANIFSGTEAEALGYLNKAAMDPASIVDYTLNLRSKNASIAASEASAAKDRALTGAYGQGLKAANLIDVKRPDGTVTQVDRSKYMVDGELQLPKGYSLIKAEQTAAQLPAALKTRYDELVKSDRWERARTADERILLLEKEGIPPSLVGLRSPTDDLIALMKSGGGKPAPAAAPVATPAGQQLVNLAGQMLPPAPIAPVAPTTSAQRLRGLYLSNQ